jgi:hypothetical protein
MELGGRDIVYGERVGRTVVLLTTFCFCFGCSLQIVVK